MLRRRLPVCLARELSRWFLATQVLRTASEREPGLFTACWAELYGFNALTHVPYILIDNLREPQHAASVGGG